MISLFFVLFFSFLSIYQHLTSLAPNNSLDLTFKATSSLSRQNSFDPQLSQTLHLSQNKTSIQKLKRNQTLPLLEEEASGPPLCAWDWDSQGLPIKSKPSTSSLQQKAHFFEHTAEEKQEPLLPPSPQPIHNEEKHILFTRLELKTPEEYNETTLTSGQKQELSSLVTEALLNTSQKEGNVNLIQLYQSRSSQKYTDNPAYLFLNQYISEYYGKQKAKKTLDVLYYNPDFFGALIQNHDAHFFLFVMSFMSDCIKEYPEQTSKIYNYAFTNKSTVGEFNLSTLQENKNPLIRRTYQAFSELIAPTLQKHKQQDALKNLLSLKTRNPARFDFNSQKNDTLFFEWLTTQIQQNSSSVSVNNKGHIDLNKLYIEGDLNARRARLFIDNYFPSIYPEEAPSKLLNMLYYNPQFFESMLQKNDIELFKIIMSFLTQNVTNYTSKVSAIDQHIFNNPSLFEDSLALQIKNHFNPDFQKIFFNLSKELFQQLSRQTPVKSTRSTPTDNKQKNSRSSVSSLTLLHPHTPTHPSILEEEISEPSISQEQIDFFQHNIVPSTANLSFLYLSHSPDSVFNFITQFAPYYYQENSTQEILSTLYSNPEFFSLLVKHNDSQLFQFIMSFLINNLDTYPAEVFHIYRQVFTLNCELPSSLLHQINQHSNPLFWTLFCSLTDQLLPLFPEELFILSEPQIQSIVYEALSLLFLNSNDLNFCNKFVETPLFFESNLRTSLHSFQQAPSVALKNRQRLPHFFSFSGLQTFLSHNLSYLFFDKIHQSEQASFTLLTSGIYVNLNTLYLASLHDTNQADSFIKTFCPYYYKKESSIRVLYLFYSNPQLFVSILEMNDISFFKSILQILSCHIESHPQEVFLIYQSLVVDNFNCPTPFFIQLISHENASFFYEYCRFTKQLLLSEPTHKPVRDLLRKTIFNPNPSLPLLDQNTSTLSHNNTLLHRFALLENADLFIHLITFIRDIYCIPALQRHVVSYIVSTFYLEATEFYNLNFLQILATLNRPKHLEYFLSSMAQLCEIPEIQESLLPILRCLFLLQESNPDTLHSNFFHIMTQLKDPRCFIGFTYFFKNIILFPSTQKDALLLLNDIFLSQSEFLPNFLLLIGQNNDGQLFLHWCSFMEGLCLFPPTSAHLTRLLTTLLLSKDQYNYTIFDWIKEYNNPTMYTNLCNLLYKLDYCLNTHFTHTFLPHNGIKKFFHPLKNLHKNTNQDLNQETTDLNLHLKKLISHPQSLFECLYDENSQALWNTSFQIRSRFFSFRHTSLLKKSPPSLLESIMNLHDKTMIPDTFIEMLFSDDVLIFSYAPRTPQYEQWNQRVQSFVNSFQPRISHNKEDPITKTTGSPVDESFNHMMEEWMRDEPIIDEITEKPIIQTAEQAIDERVQASLIRQGYLQDFQPTLRSS